MRYSISHMAEYAAVVAAGALIRALPLRAALALGWFVAAASHFVGRVHVKRTRQRVRAVLGPGAPEREVRRVAWRSWCNLCFNAIEGFRFSRLTPEKVRRLPMARLEARLKAIHAQGGFIMATPHNGNWEIAGVAADLLGLPVFTIARKQKNPLINNYIDRMRRSFSLELLYRDSKSWKGVVDRLRQGKVLGVLPDIGVRGRGVEVDFLNGTATIAPGAAQFALLANCPVYPVVVRRVGWTRHDAILLDPVVPDPAADRDTELHRIMREVMAALSAEILKAPEQYFWHNKRWVLNAR